MSVTPDARPSLTGEGATMANYTVDPPQPASPTSVGERAPKVNEPIYSEAPKDSTLPENPVTGISHKVEGFVDLETLGKIEKSLNDSADADDISLAAWIKENYLYEPIGKLEDGRSIQNREGFEKLDKAYKRVRLLTNRAQDKWPFFDRHWKKIPANTVRQVTQGLPTLHGMSAPPETACFACVSVVCPVNERISSMSTKVLSLTSNRYTDFGVRYSSA
jgi:hypothetical protein